MDKTNYKYDFICTYKLIDEEFRDMLYQQQILDAFDLERFDANILREKQKNLYEEIKTEADFIRVFEFICKKQKHLFCKDNLEAFIILFSYDYFNLFHRCLIDYFMNGMLNKLNYERLMDEISGKEKDEMGKNEMGKDEMGKDEMGKNEMGKDEMGKDEMGKDEMGKNEMGKNEEKE